MLCLEHWPKRALKSPSFSFAKTHLETNPTFVKKIIFVLAKHIWDWASGHQAHFRLMFLRNVPDYGSLPGLKLITDQLLADLLSLITGGQEAGLLNQGDARSIARQVWAAVHGVSLLFIDSQFKPFENNSEFARALVRELLTNLIRGLKPKSDS